MNNARATLVCCTLGLSAGSTIGLGAENRVDPRIEIGAKYDSNPWLQPSGFPGSGSASGGIVDASVGLSSTSQRSSASVTPRVYASYYGSDSDKDSTDLYLIGETTYRTLRSNYGFNFNLARESVVSNELALADANPSLGTTTGGESGIILGRNTVDTASGQVTGSWTLTTRSKFNAVVGYSDTSYDHSFANAQNDFSNVNGALGWSYQATPRVSVTSSILAADFRPKSGVAGAESVGAQVEVWREQSQQLRAFLRLGAMRSDIDSPGTPGGSLNRTTPVLGAGIARSLQRGRVFAQVTHMIDPNGSGFLLLRDDAYLQFTHDFSPRLSAVANLRGVWASAVDKSSNYADRRYFTGSAGLEWRFRRTFSLLGEYGGAQQNFSGGLPSASSNAFTLSLVYQPNAASSKRTF